MQKTHRRYLSYLKYLIRALLSPACLSVQEKSYLHRSLVHGPFPCILAKKNIWKRIYAPSLSGEQLYAEFPRDER